jgi:DNA-binding NtrC family response regulator
MSLRILLVDDDDMTLKLVGRVLTSEGHRVETSSSAATALDLLCAEHDVLVTDLVMPAMSGLELAAVARERHADLRVVVMSGHGRAAEAAEDITWVDKPIEIDRLLAAITNDGPGASEPTA